MVSMYQPRVFFPPQGEMVRGNKHVVSCESESESEREESKEREQEKEKNAVPPQESLLAQVFACTCVHILYMYMYMYIYNAVHMHVCVTCIQTSRGGHFPRKRAAWVWVKVEGTHQLNYTCTCTNL